MMESLFDPRTFGAHFNKNPFKFFDIIKKENGKHHLMVPTYSGNTTNTEFEVLTGLSLSSMPPGVIGYYQVTQSIPSIPQLLKNEFGYITYALYGWKKDAFHCFP